MKFRTLSVSPAQLHEQVWLPINGLFGIAAKICYFIFILDIIKTYFK